MTDIIQQINTLPVLPNSMPIWGFGQMGVGIKTPQAILYVDLCLSDIVREQAGDHWARAYPPPAQPEALTNASYYLITHEHIDHLDPLTIKPMLQAAPDTRFIAPGWCRELLLELGAQPENILVPQAMQPITLPQTDVTLTAVPAAHYDKTYDTEKGYRWLGYMIEANGVTFYHAGDTIIYDDYIATLKQLPTPDIALLPVNGRDYYREVEGPATGNLMPIEAARLAHDLGWDMLLIGHNDLYAYNAIPFSHIVQALETTAPRQKYKILQPGELYYYVKA
ncbi:MAG: MBL fold metallo-hydrolase [Chloroflexi bacterium]|nr:MAG: MBL fold metallo-hydrolase [Chloroflexota bacterium]